MSQNQGRALSVISMINMLSFPGTDMSLDSGREDCMFWVEEHPSLQTGLKIFLLLILRRGDGSIQGLRLINMPL